MNRALNAAIAAAAALNAALHAVPVDRQSAAVNAAKRGLHVAVYAALLHPDDADLGALCERLDAAIIAAKAAIDLPSFVVGPGVHPLALAALRAESAEEQKRAEIDARGGGWGAAERAELRPFEAVRIAARKAWAAAGFPFEG